MKRLKVSLMALALMFGILGAFASTRVKHQQHKTTDLFWYNVVDGQTSGEPIFQGDKDAALGETACDDSQTPICLYGSTNGSLNNAPVGTPAPENRILHQ